MPILSTAPVDDPTEDLETLRARLGGACPKVWEARLLPRQPCASCGPSGAQTGVRSGEDRGECLSASLMCGRITQVFGAEGRDRLLSAELGAVRDLGLPCQTALIEDLAECAAETCPCRQMTAKPA